MAVRPTGQASTSAQPDSAAPSAVARRPFHRSMTAPLSTRMGALRHPGSSGIAASKVGSGQQVDGGLVTAQSEEEPSDRSMKDGTSESQPGESVSQEHTDADTLVNEQLRTASTTKSMIADQRQMNGRELSTVVADTLQLPISTLMQIIPPHLLDPSHERLSAMSLQIPVASVEALLESFRVLNWICGRMSNAAFGAQNPTVAVQPSQLASGQVEKEAGGGEAAETLDAGDQSIQSCPSSESRPGPSQVAAKRDRSAPRRRMMQNSSSQSLEPIESLGMDVEADFDLLELSQRVADVVSGQAAEKGIQLVLTEAGSELRAPEGDKLKAAYSVRGDEGATRFAVMQLLARVIDASSPRTVVECGPLVDRAVTSDQDDANANTAQHQLECTYAVSLHGDQNLSRDCKIVLDDATTQLLRSVGAEILLDHPSSSERETTGRSRWILKLPLRPGSPLLEAKHREPAETEARQRFLPALELAEEPSAADLEEFAQKELRGRKIALHASHTSRFAQLLSAQLGALGCETAHLPLEGDAGNWEETRSWTGTGAEDESSLPRTAIALSRDNRPSLIHYPSNVGMGVELARGPQPSHDRSNSDDTAVLDPVTGVPVVLHASAMIQAQPQKATGHASSDQKPGSPLASGSGDGEKRGQDSTTKGPLPFSFVLIDDDIETLQRELLRMRSATTVLRSALGPSKSTSSKPASVQRVMNDGRVTSDHAGYAPQTYAIIHFTSLKKYRIVRDAIQPIVESAAAQRAPLPEVIVIPQPLGIRRLLTAMHTAVHKPLVDPFFSAIATSPMSPSTAPALKQVNGSAPALPSPGIVEVPRMLDIQGAGDAVPDSHGRSEAIDTASKLGASVGLAAGELRTHETRAAEPKDVSRHPALHLDMPPRDPALDLLGRQKASIPQEATRSLPESGDGARKPSAPRLAKSSATTPLADSVPGKQGISRAVQAVPATNHLAPGLPSTASAMSHHSGGSPLPLDALGYFSETASRLGSRGASGMVIQSPDGRPAGIFFQPRTSSQGNRTPASTRRGSDNSNQQRSSADAGSSQRTGEHTRRQQQHSGELTPATLKSALDNESSKAARRERKTSATGSVESVAGPSSPRSWNYPAGSLFVPQVGIESILSGGRPPLATPLDESARASGVWEPSRAETASQHGTGPSASASPLSRVLPPRSTQQPLISALSNVSLPKASAAGAPSTIAESAKSTVPEHPHSPIQKEELAPAPLGEAGDRIPESPVAAINPISAARHSFAAPQSQESRRPSAQPQSGLLIGAGFAPKAKKGTGPKPAPVRQKVLPPIKVLIVEDNPINQAILQKFMKRKQISWEAARDGREAIDKWAKGGFHLILMDIQLPVMDGIEATKEIRKLERLDNVGLPSTTPPASQITTGVNAEDVQVAPAKQASEAFSVPATPFRASVIIVALTASVLNSDRVAALAAGCNDFLNKPVDLNWLERKLWEWGSIQYIVLSGQLSTAARKASAGGRGALEEARGNREVQRGFGSGPDALAKKIADSLHIVRKSSPAPAASPNASVKKAAPKPDL
ncbi:Sensory transduction histidine kinase [Ceraceosorus bombacis]|uniref:Sensory transduction histidine kinase n=1 Tax=Ceraceosorus bombacis TaxID=401625 RepID=A0A0P1B9A0_9BASI|nr:Sensory transduction histidine kinase [Ceraceosorus bombacis]